MLIDDCAIVVSIDMPDGGGITQEGGRVDESNTSVYGLCLCLS